MIWKVEAQGDTIYFNEDTREEAEQKFKEIFGAVPKRLVKWAEIDAIPDGEEPI